MKIDLHIHTKEMFKGDGKSRNVDFKTFNNSLRNAKVKLAAITNHNHFDDKQFKNFQDEESYLLLPGIEVDFLENKTVKKRSQLNIIFSNNDIEAAKNISDFLENKKISGNNPIPIKELLEKIEKENIILYIDNKNGKTKVSKNCANYINNKLKNIPLIHDANNIRTLRILMSSKTNALIGSDLQDWNEYSKNSNNLVESQWKINNFNSFKEVLNTGKPLNEWLRKLEHKLFSFKIENDEIKIEILKSGINIIIGDKATGKSKILEKIGEEIGEKDVSFFSEDKKNDEFKKFIEKPKNIFTNNLLIEKELKNKFENLAKLKVKNNNSPIDFFNETISPNRTEWKIQDSKLEHCKNIDFDKLKKLVEIKNDLDNFLKSNNDILFLNDFLNEYKKVVKKLNEFIKKIQKNFILKNIDLISSSFSDKIKESVRKIIKEEKGIKSNNLSVGLWNYYDFKNKFEKESKEIKKIKLSQYEKNILKDDIPTIGKIKIIDKNGIIPFSKVSDIKKHNSLDHKIKNIKKSLECFINKKTTFENIKIFQDYWNEENINKGFIYCKRIIVDDKDKTIELSSGQQSILLLSRALNSGKEYILLDEPSSRIGSNSIMKYVNEKIEKLRRSGKTLIITTHNSNLGINVLPNEYFLRIKNEKKYETLWSHIYCDYFFDNNNEKRLEFNEVVLDLLEGGEKAYEERRKIYESKVNN